MKRPGHPPNAFDVVYCTWVVPKMRRRGKKTPGRTPTPHPPYDSLLGKISKTCQFVDFVLSKSLVLHCVRWSIDTADELSSDGCASRDDVEIDLCVAKPALAMLKLSSRCADWKLNAMDWVELAVGSQHFWLWQWFACRACQWPVHASVSLERLCNEEIRKVQIIDALIEHRKSAEPENVSNRSINFNSNSVEKHPFTCLVAWAFSAQGFP